jgi:hypothetical protein
VIDLATYILLASGALIGVGLTLLFIAGTLWLVVKLSEDK